MISNIIGRYLLSKGLSLPNSFLSCFWKEEDTYKDGADRGGGRIYDPDTGRAGV